MKAYAVALIAGIAVLGCGSPQSHSSAQPEGPVHHHAVVVLETAPIDLSGPITLDRAIQVALSRRRLVVRQGGAPNETDRISHERNVRYRTAQAYAAYLRAHQVLALRVRQWGTMHQVLGEIDGDPEARGDVVMRNMVALMEGRSHLDSLAAEHDVHVATHVLNLELARGGDEALGDPSETQPSSIRLSTDDLIARALRVNRAVEDRKPERVVRGEIVVAMQRLDRLESDWRIFESDVMPPVQSLNRWIGPDAVYHHDTVLNLARATREDYDARVEREECMAEILDAAADLEAVVGEALPRTELSSPPSSTP